MLGEDFQDKAPAKMGTFSHSYIVMGATPDSLLAFYRADGTRAFIYAEDRNVCAVCDDNDDEPDLELLINLTNKLQTKALLGQVFDSSAFVATTFDRGAAIDEYIDYPEYLPGLVTGNPILYLNRVLTTEERATEWSTLFETPHKASTLADLLDRRAEYDFAEDFHESILQALMLPTAMVGQVFVQIERAYQAEPGARKVLLYSGDAL
jgi:hypothetical protein